MCVCVCVCVCVCECEREELHVAEGGSDKHLHLTCHIAVEEVNLLLHPPNHDFFLHLSLTSLLTWGLVFPQFDMEQNVSNHT